MTLDSETRKWLCRGFVVSTGVILIILTTWIAIAGPVTVFRIIRYGDTDIDDFSHYPGRVLRASDSPFRFAQSDEALDVPTAALLDYGNEGDLEQILEANDSIAFLIVQGDAILYERYFQGHTLSSLSQSFSMAKSLTSALIGMAIDDGYMAGVDQSIVDFVPELADEGFNDVEIHHLLTMMSGSSYVENDNPFGEHVILNYTPHLEEEILNFEMEREPGDVFRYKSGDNALLALALDRALGAETITDYTERRLWTPLGMAYEGVWTVDREGEGLEKTWCCLAATARDFAKLGRLYLDQGVWEGELILSSDWVERSTRGQVPEAAWPSRFESIGWWNYGYQWWLASEDEGDYFALGKDGQFVYVNPIKDLIIVRLGWSMGDLGSSEWVSLFRRIGGLVD
jgi:CubicO group peptidase (beta-lactamase class C family)